MKKTLHLFVTATLLLSTIQLSAADYKYLILQSASGDKNSLAIDKLSLTFNGDVLTANQGGTVTTYSVANLSKMFFTENLTAIHATEASRTAVSLDGAQLQIQAPAGTVAQVYDATGRLIMSTKISAEGSPSHVNLLRQGIYVVKAGSETLKILVK